MIEIEAHPRQDDLKLVEQGLVSHAERSGVEARQHRALTVFLRDDRGRVVGGLVGATVWGWLSVKQLWVCDELRRRGHWAQLLRSADEEAVRRGCHHALLDTFDFQAPRFYQRLGYEIFGEAPDFPRGHTRFFLRKTLASAGAQAGSNG